MQSRRRYHQNTRVCQMILLCRLFEFDLPRFQKKHLKQLGMDMWIDDPIEGRAAGFEQLGEDIIGI